MKLLKWIKENFFEYSGPTRNYGHRPPPHPPGWKNVGNYKTCKRCLRQYIKARNGKCPYCGRSVR